MLCNHADNYTCHEDCFQVTLTTAAGFDTLKCGCRPWIRRVPVRVYNLVNITIHCVRAVYIIIKQFIPNKLQILCMVDL